MFVAIDGARLFVDVLNPQLAIDGAGLREKPQLLCIPGGPGGDHQTLRPFFDRFASLAQVIYLDPRGGGRSEPGDPATWTLDQWGDDIAAVCDALGLDKPVVLGSSGGSIMVQAFLARHPERAGGAILINPCARMQREPIIAGFGRLGGPQAEAAARAMYETGAAAAVPAFIQTCFQFYSARRNFADLRAAGSRVRMNPAPSEAFFGPDGEAFRYDHRGSLGQVSCPVLLLVGGQDPLTRPEWGREVAVALPAGRADLHILEAASHLVTADEPERVSALLEHFIAAR